MRCPSCNKFASYDEPQVEINSAEVQNGTLLADVRVVLNSACCGDELKDCEFQIEEDVTDLHVCPGLDEMPEDSEYEVESSDGTGTERRETQDKKGKPINYRYQRQYYGAEVMFTVRCLRCDMTFDLTVDVEEQASSFNELT